MTVMPLSPQTFAGRTCNYYWWQEIKKSQTQGGFKLHDIYTNFHKKHSNLSFEITRGRQTFGQRDTIPKTYICL